MKKAILLSVFMFTSVFGFSQIDKFKAMFIYHAAINTNFSSDKSSGDFVIGINDSPGLLKMLTGLAKAKKVKGRKIVVKAINGPADAAGCNIVFVPTVKISSFKDACIAGKTLLYSEGSGGCATGAQISFFIDGKKPNFEISKANMGAAGLTPSGKILAMGKKV
jgi:hypothetical protein